MHPRLEKSQRHHPPDVSIAKAELPALVKQALQSANLPFAKERGRLSPPLPSLSPGGRENMLKCIKQLRAERHHILILAFLGALPRG